MNYILLIIALFILYFLCTIKFETRNVLIITVKPKPVVGVTPKNLKQSVSTPNALTPSTLTPKVTTANLGNPVQINKPHYTGIHPKCSTVHHAGTCPLNL